MKKLLFTLITVLSVISFSSCAERIDAGHEGIKVNLYGDNKGVDNVSLVTGMIWYNPFTTQIYEYPSFVQTVDYDSFTINAKDGSEFSVDPTISLKIKDGSSPIIFKKYRKNLDEVINKTLFNYVKDAFRIQLNKFTTDEIVSKREEIEKAIETQLISTLSNENFEIHQLTSGLKYPESIIKAINAKNKAVQDQMRVSNEVLVAKAEAEKRIVAAEAEFKANELKTKSLTQAVLQQMWIEKWNGNVPKVITNGNSSMFIDISKF